MTSEPGTSEKPDSGPSLVSKDRFRALLLILLALASIALCTEFFLVTSPASPKTFTFSQSETIQGTSLSVTGVTGELKATPWSQSGILINGTVSVAGSGASPVQVTFHQQAYPGNVFFEPVFPDPGQSQGRNYQVDVNVYFPLALNFSSYSLDTTTGSIQVSGVIASTISLRTESGDVDASNLQSSVLQFSSTSGTLHAANVTTTSLSANSNGDVQVILEAIKQGGTYTGASSKGTVDFHVPAASSFRLTAYSLFGHAGYYSGFSDCQKNYTAQNLAGNSFESTFTATCGTGSATIALNAIYGDATITRG